MKSIYGKYAKLLVNYSLELKKGDKFLTEIQITMMPPQLIEFPIQIILSDKKENLVEFRIWFTGASLIIGAVSKSP